MLSLYCLGGLVCVILHRLSTLARGHQGLFKPPLTPERFWDPDIIEDSADDPRNKIFHASPLRKRREEKAFEVGEVVNGDEFE